MSVIVLRPSKGWAALDLRALWAYRELLYFLTWRDIKVRYKQTVLGGLWAIIQPLFTMLVFYVVFGKLARLPSDGIPYPLFSFVALVPWTFFSTSLSNASNSLVGSANLITKVYFPRLVVPISTVLAAGVDLALALLVLFGMMGYYGIVPTIRILYLPLFLLLAAAAALGSGLWLTALNVQFRDVRYTVPFLVTLWMYASPIVYPTSLFPERWRPYYGLNPMAGVIDGVRWCLLSSGPAPATLILLSCASTLILLVSGAFYFRRMERGFADVV